MPEWFAVPPNFKVCCRTPYGTGLNFFYVIGAAGVTAAIVAAIYRWVHQHLDITILIATFVISLAMLLVGMLFGGTQGVRGKSQRNDHIASA